jgi:high affinity sulfate transporter 1
MTPERAPDAGRPDQPVEGERTPFDATNEPFAPPPKPPLVQRVVPVTANVGGYFRHYVRADVVAGLTIAALAIPSAMAYAEVAGLPPVAGLYGLILPAIAYAVFGSSRQLVVGPEAAIALLVAVAVAPLANGDPTKYAALCAMLALMVAGVYFIGYIVRMGWIADYFSRAVLVGYIHGMVVVLIIGQLGKLLGLSISESEPIPQLKEVAHEIGQTSWATVVVSVTSIAALLLIRRFAPKLPAPLIVVVLAIIVSAAFDLAAHGITTIGNIPPGLPKFTFPAVSMRDFLDLLPAAFGIFCVGYADGVLTGRSFAGRHGQSVRANQEMLAFGAANAAAGFTQSFPVGASGSRTAVNDQSGGKTQFVGVISALTVALVLLFLTQPVEKLPKAVLGAVIVVAAMGLVDLKEWRALASAGRVEIVIASVTMFGVIVVGVLWGLAVAVALSIIHTTSRSAKPHDAVLGWVERLGRYADASTHPSAKLTPGVMVYRLDDRLFYANANYVHGRILEAIDAATTATRWLVFDVEGITDLDSTATEMLEQLLDQLDAKGIKLAISRAKGPLMGAFDSSGLTERIGAESFFPNVETAVHDCAERIGA